MPIPTPELVGKATAKEKVWGHLMGDGVCKIGICGMGGIGKTTIVKHVHNEHLKNTKFDQVIWVTVSQDLDIVKIQEDIASALKEKLSATDKTMRAAQLSVMLTKRKRYVLILDDVWKTFPLEDVGIPEPTVDNGCKLVLTTRSKDVARSMGYEVIPVDLLSENEALNLFLKYVGDNLLRIPTIESILKQVVEQCAGLPLAVVTVASSMRDAYNVDLWKNALNDLKERTISVEGITDEVIHRLKFSYDRLMDPRIKLCFLYCALYPEDHNMWKEELIEYWIVEGLVDEMETRQAMQNKGHAILNKLQNNCLLESVEDGKCVKMHDLVREMALHITAVSPRYLVKGGKKLTSLPHEKKWTNDLEKVSLMRNCISEIPFNLSFPKCGTLSTLLMQHNGIRGIHESFFEHMIGLKILDLSHNPLERLPDSISELRNLVALLLHGCFSLNYVPSLERLGSLKKLDLGLTNIKVVPQGVEMLAHLTYLNLNSLDIRRIPVGVLSKLFRIQYLWLFDAAFENTEDILRFTKLENLGVRFDNLQDYHLYLSLQSRRRLSKYYFSVGMFGGSPFRDKYVGFIGLTICENSIVLPNDIQELCLINCDGVRRLSYIFSFKDTTELRICKIRWCRQIESVLSLSSCYGVLETLECLELECLEQLNTLFEMERDKAVASSLQTSIPSPPNIIPRLKFLRIYGCNKLKKLLLPELLLLLQNLEEISVCLCEGLVEIIEAPEQDDGENKEAGKSFIKLLALPKLRVFQLLDLPNLLRICSSGSTMVCNSLQTIIVQYCPRMKRIPVLLPQLENEQPGSFGVDVRPKQCWDSLEWDDPKTKNVSIRICRCSFGKCICDKAICKISSWMVQTTMQKRMK